MAMKIKVNEAVHKSSVRGTKPANADFYAVALQVIKERDGMLARLRDM